MLISFVRSIDSVVKPKVPLAVRVGIAISVRVLAWNSVMRAGIRTSRGICSIQSVAIRRRACAGKVVIELRRLPSSSTSSGRMKSEACGPFKAMSAGAVRAGVGAKRLKSSAKERTGAIEWGGGGIAGKLPRRVRGVE